MRCFSESVIRNHRGPVWRADTSSILQRGFRPKMGTKEGIFNPRTIFERALEVGKEVHICFIDYTKAFDRVKQFKNGRMSSRNWNR